MSMTIRIARERGQGAGPAGLAQGGFFSFVGNLAKKAVGSIPFVGPIASSFIPTFGGPPKIHPAQKRIQREALRASATAQGLFINRPIPASFQGGQQIVQGPGIGNALARLLPGGSTGLVVAGGGADPGMGCPSGFHANKSDYYTQQGFVPKGTRCVRNRRRNALNPRALTHAISRVTSAKTAAKILGRITIRKACD